MAIIIKPIVTEKMTAASEINTKKAKKDGLTFSEKFNRYGFMVVRTANKVEIKKAVEAMYNVQVVDVNTIVVGPKNKQRYTKSGLLRGKTMAYKKAIITTKKDDVIDFYSNI